jgi:predicted amidohydrolase YtcJ
MKLALTHGKIYQEADCFVQACLIADGWIKTCGSNELILSLMDEDTQHIDLQGKLVLPGFNDAHLHFYNTARFLEWANLHQLSSIQELIDTMQHYVSTHQGELIYGMGWNQERFEMDQKRYPNRYDLDLITTDKPMVLYRMDAHVVVCNSLALSLMMDVFNPPKIEGGLVECDENGIATGILRENALRLLDCLPVEENPQLIKTRIQRMVNLAHAQGITSVQINDLHIDEQSNPIEEAYLHYAQHQPKLRIYHQICFKSLDAFKARIQSNYFLQQDAFLRYGPLKLFADGTLGARTAALHDAYADAPTEKGILTLSPDELKAWIHTAHKHQISVVVHTIGDRAMDAVMDVYESLNDPNNSLRHGLIHLQISTPPLLKRVAKLRIVAYVQPIFLNQDMHVLVQRVGEARAQTSYAFKTLSALGCVVAYSSDAPIESFNVFENLHCAVLRQDLNDFPEGGFYPHESVSLSEAIDAMTLNGAYASFEENVKGRLKEGYLADMVVLDQDIFVEPLEKLRHTQVEMTFVGGELVYKKGS